MRSLDGIYAIVDPARTPAIVEYARALIDGGVQIVQYRDKRGSDRAAIAALAACCRAANAVLIVNDDLEGALLADGVHLGQDDLARISIARAREALGARIIGVSAATPELARRAQQDGADYIGCGPYKATRSKETARAPLGVHGLRAVVASVRIPVAAIGGIELDDLGEIAATGARMAAVISALADATDPQAAARRMVERWERA